MLKPRSFYVYKNATALMIAMLGRLELDMEILDTGMETMESDDCREMSRKNGDANGILVITRERVRYLLLGIGVQLVIFCTIIEIQIVFKMLLVLITGQLAVASQLGKEVHPQSIGLFLRSRK